MGERESPFRPKVPDILTRPFAEGLHPYTRRFLNFSYEQGGYEHFADDLQRDLFDLYFIGDLTLAGQNNIGRRNLEKEIRDGFRRLRVYISQDLSDAFPENFLPYFKVTDISYTSNPESELKKRMAARNRFHHKGVKRSKEIREKTAEVSLKRSRNPAYREKNLRQLEKARQKSRSLESRKKRGRTLEEKWREEEFRDMILAKQRMARERRLAEQAKQKDQQ